MATVAEALPSLPEGVLFQAFPKQQQFADAVFSGRYLYLMYGGAIRSGKTYLVIALVLLLCRIFPGSRWAMVRKDLPTLRRNLLPVFEKLRPETFCGPVNQQTWTATCVNGSQIVFFTEGYEEDKDLNRWKGLEVNGFVLEEANELQSVSFEKAKERAGSWVIPRSPHNPSPTQPKPLILLTVNPAPGWVKHTFYVPWRNGTLKEPYYFCQALLTDNPFLPKDYVESLKYLDALSYRRFVLGDWDTVEGAAFEELSIDTHLVTGEELAVLMNAGFPKPWWPQWSAFDWGYAHPYAAAAFTKSDDGTIYVIETISAPKRLDVEIAREMRRNLPAKALLECWADSKAFARRMAHEGTAQTVEEALRPFEIGLQRANTDRVPGWQAVRRGISVRAPNPVTGRPYVLWLDTKGNRRGIEAMKDMVIDRDSPTGEDVLKVDADPKTGLGGDDIPDCYRYGIVQYMPAGEAPVQVTTPEEYLARGQDPNQQFVSQVAGERTAEDELRDQLALGAWGALEQLPEGF